MQPAKFNADFIRLGSHIGSPACLSLDSFAKFSRTRKLGEPPYFGNILLFHIPKYADVLGYLKSLISVCPKWKINVFFRYPNI